MRFTVREFFLWMTLAAPLIAMTPTAPWIGVSMAIAIRVAMLESECHENE